MSNSLFPDDLVTTESIRDRIAELESEHTDDDGEMIGVGLWDETDRREYRGLVDILEEVGGHPQDSVTLIHENYFQDYIRSEFSEVDSGQYGVAIPEGYHDGKYRSGGYERISIDDLMRIWPFNCIDWEHAAEEQRSLFTPLEIDGVTYLYDAP